MSFFTRETSESNGVEKKSSWMKVAFSVLSFFLFLSLLATLYFYTQYKKSVSDQTKISQNEVEQIKEKIGRLMEIPDEMPTLATIDDKTKLEKSTFFSRAENGDKILLFTNAKKAILFRPSTGKIVDVTVINVTDGKQSTASAEEIQNTKTAEETSVQSKTSSEETLVTSSEEGVNASPKVALYNGSMKIGVTNTLEDKIIAQFPEVTIEKKEKAMKSDYSETEVIDLSGKNTDITAKLASFVGGKVITELPSAEANPGTDILIIVGQK